MEYLKTKKKYEKEKEFVNASELKKRGLLLYFLFQFKILFIDMKVEIPKLMKNLDEEITLNFD